MDSKAQFHFNRDWADQPIHPETQIAEYAYDKVEYSTHVNSNAVSTSLLKKINDHTGMLKLIKTYKCTKLSKSHSHECLLPNSDTTK